MSISPFGTPPPVFTKHTHRQWQERIHDRCFVKFGVKATWIRLLLSSGDGRPYLLRELAVVDQQGIVTAQIYCNDRGAIQWRKPKPEQIESVEPAEPMLIEESRSKLKFVK